MKEDKRHSRFPRSKIHDGTMKKLNQLDWQIYNVIASSMDYMTHESWVSYTTIRKYVSATSGTRILESVMKLQELGLIDTHKQPKRNRDGAIGKYERRLYTVKN